MKKKKLLNLLLVIIWMTVIFVMSSFNATDSGNQSGLIVSFISNIIHIDNPEFISHIVRKTAHFTEYFILGILFLNYIKDYKLRNKIMISIIFCFIYASLDEFHQTFVPGRAGLFSDVLIDTFGAITGIILYFLLILKRNAKK